MCVRIWYLSFSFWLTSTSLELITSHWSDWLSSKSLQAINAGEGVEKREGSHCWWECKLIQPLWKTVWRFLKKKKKRNETTIWPNSPTPRHVYLEETKIEKDTCVPLFTAAPFTIARAWKQLRCASTNEWIKRYIYTMEYYSAINE